MEIMVLVLVILVLFWFTLVAPTRRQINRQKSDVASLQIGDRVVTTAGFLATVHEIHTPEQGPIELTLDLGSGLLVRALPSAIAQRLSDEPAINAQSSGEAANIP
jgi:preprotein translocase YajC subunit